MAHTWTWQKLAQNAYRLNPKSRGPKYPGVPRFEFGGFVSGQNKDQKVIVPYKGTNSLLISMRAWGVTQASLHNVTLLFSNVEILTENPNNSNYFQVQYNGIMYWCKKLDKTRNPMANRCTCRDYFFTASFYNHRNGCLYGPKPRPYVRKTTTYPERNKLHAPLICKHIYHAWTILRNSGLTIN